MNVEKRLAVIETLLGLRELGDPRIEELRLKQAAYASNLLAIAKNTPESQSFKKRISKSYVKGSSLMRAGTK